MVVLGSPKIVKGSGLAIIGGKMLALQKQHNFMVYDYNTQRTKMALPEYGRNVQKMINHIKTIENRDERNRAARSIIQIMGNLNPHLRDVGDFKHKLWDHLALISNFELDIDSPYPKPEPSKFTEKPKVVPYNQGPIRFMHYGRIIQDMIRSVAAMEEGNEKKYLTNLVLNQMKKSYLTWNKATVTDELIIADFEMLSGGKIKVAEGTKLLESRELVPQQPKKKPQMPGKMKKKPLGKQPFQKKKPFTRH
jgi:ureidoglycolate hydrolase